MERPPVTNIPNGTEEVHENGTGEKAGDTAALDPDSYEARRDARRKARDERMKAAAAKSVEVYVCLCPSIHMCAKKCEGAKVGRAW